jgi:hypothetical protein
VLQFDTVHAITDHLYLADDAHTPDSLAAAVVLLLHEHSDPTSSRRLVRAVEYPPPTADADRGLPEQLLRFARGLTAVTDRASGTGETGPRLLAGAVRYADIDLDADTPRVVQRIDAVDTDGRVYRLVRHCRVAPPTLLIDDTAVPHDVPATHPALLDILAAGTASEAPRS